MSEAAETTATRCVGCGHVFEEGDRYIVDTAAGFAEQDADPEVDSLLAGIFGATDGKVRFCENCTEPGDKYVFKTFARPA